MGLTRNLFVALAEMVESGQRPACIEITPKAYAEWQATMQQDIFWNPCPKIRRFRRRAPNHVADFHGVPVMCRRADNEAAWCVLDERAARDAERREVREAREVKVGVARITYAGPLNWPPFRPDTQA